jgi:hypothetical protein
LKKNHVNSATVTTGYFLTRKHPAKTPDITSQKKIGILLQTPQQSVNYIPMTFAIRPTIMVSPHTFFVFFSLIISTAFGQQTINNTSTPGYLPVAGTKVSIIPPSGFEKASNFAGFQQPQSGSSIMVVSIPGPVEKVQTGLTEDVLLSQGVEISDIEKLTVNGMPAVFLTGTQNAYGNVYSKLILCFGTTSESVMINGVFPKNLLEVGRGVKKSILGAYFDADKKVDPFEAIDFEITTAGSQLIFAKSMANSFIYNIDGKLPTESTDRTSYLIGKSFSKVQLDDKKLFCLNRIKQLHPEIKVDLISELSVDGISGYELSGDVKNKKYDQDEKIYQAILFSDNLYYIMIGSTNTDFASNLKVFKSVTQTFKRK